MRKVLTEEQRLRRNRASSEWQRRNKDRANAKAREWALANPDKRRETRKRSRAKNPYGNTKHKAHARGFEWTLSAAEYYEIKSRPCHYCKRQILSASGGLDRIDNSRGYHIDNVLPCCVECNKTRNDIYTVEETEVMISALLEFRKTRGDC
jgi:hypothetical protein